MTNREFFLSRWEPEQPAFLRVLRALPADKLDYKPHERSTSAGDLAWQLSEELRVLAGVTDSGDINWESVSRPATLDEIVAAYEANADPCGHSSARWTRRDGMAPDVFSSEVTKRGRPASAAFSGASSSTPSITAAS